MFRFILSLLVFGGIAFGIYNFVSPLNQLAKNSTLPQDEYEKLLTEALQRNNPEAFSQDNISEKTDSKSTFGTSVSENDNTQTPTPTINKAFSYNTYYDRSKNRVSREKKSVQVRTGTSPYTRDSGAKGYFGTPLINPEANKVRVSNQEGGIIFNPPIVPPPFPTNDGPMMFGMFTKIRGPGNNWSL